MIELGMDMRVSPLVYICKVKLHFTPFVLLIYLKSDCIPMSEKFERRIDAYINFFIITFFIHLTYKKYFLISYILRKYNLTITCIAKVKSFTILNEFDGVACQFSV